jgi:hypothetical protein
MRLAAGEEIVFEDIPEPARIGYLFLSQAPVEMERVVALDGIEELRADPRVDEVVINRGPGAAVDWREGNNGYVFSVTGTAADHDELADLYQRVATGVRVRGE